MAMGKGWQICKVRKSVHLCLAPLIWTAVGTVLMVRGWIWIGPGLARFFVILALLVGTLKALFVLDKTAERTIQRIMAFSERTCIFAVYSWKTWLLVALMMTFGITMRTLTDPGVGIGSLYIAIGWALLFASRRGWLAWWHLIHHDDIS